MKKSITLAFLLISGIAFSQTKPILFTIAGKIDDIKEPASAVLQYSYQGKRVSDTAAITNGTFALKGTIDKPDRSVLVIVKKSDNPRMMLSMDYAGNIVGKDGITLYLDKGAISINGPTLSKATVKGSVAHDQHTALQKNLKPIYDKLESINKKRTALTTDERKGSASQDLDAETQNAFKEMGPIQEAFIKANLNSYVSWNIVSGKSIIDNPVKQKELLYSFGDKFLKSEDGKAAIERLETAFKTAVGQPAPLFAQNDTEGNSVSLASLKGKYVLIDFWASWCGPCRAENPNVVKAYNKFKDKNFEIIAVSLDEKHDNWVKAIKDDGMPWIHVSDLKGWKNEVGILYNVRAVPQNWLIDPNGIIVAKNLRGKEIEDKLAEIIK